MLNAPIADVLLSKFGPNLHVRNERIARTPARMGVLQATWRCSTGGDFVAIAIQTSP
jgi:hypothetical protein